MVKLLFIDFNHVIFIFTLSVTHHLFFTLIVILIVHELSIGLSLHHLLLHHLLLVHAIIVFNLVLHAFDSFVFDVDLFVFVLVTFSHAILSLLVHLLLLLLYGLSDGGLLLGVQIVEVSQVLFI